MLPWMTFARDYSHLLLLLLLLVMTMMNDKKLMQYKRLESMKITFMIKMMKMNFGHGQQSRVLATVRSTAA